MMIQQSNIDLILQSTTSIRLILICCCFVCYPIYNVVAIPWLIPNIYNQVEHVMREQIILAANEFIELFSELIVQRLSIIAKQRQTERKIEEINCLLVYHRNKPLATHCYGFICSRDCPADLKEGISSLIFASPRCSEIPELVALWDIFEKKYGKNSVGAAIDLRPDCGVIRETVFPHFVDFYSLSLC